MPRTLSFPPPSATRCPICATDIDQPACPRCGAVFTTEDGSTLWRVDHDLFDLCRIRNDVVRRLLTAADHARAAGSSAAPAAGVGQRIASASTSEGPAPAPAAGSWAPPAPEGRPDAVGQRIASESPSDAVGQRIASESPSDAVGQRIASESTSEGPAVDVPWSPVAPPAPAAPAARAEIVGQRIASASPADATTWASSAPPAPAPLDPSWARPPVAPTGADAPWWSPRPTASPSGPAGPVPPTGVAVGPVRPPRPRLTIAEVLVGLGGLSLVAAVIVFAAVTWSDLAAWAQGGLIVAASALVLTLTAIARRRDLVATAESLGAVGVALALADVHVARVGLATPARPSWAIGLAVAAAGLVAFGARAKVRTTALAGCALALVPLPLFLADAGRLPLAAGLAAQALLAALVAARLVDRPLERTIVEVGAVMSWIGAVALAGAVATTDLTADPVRSPLTAAAVLAGLAVGSIVVSRTSDRSELAPVLAGAGIVLAFVPAPLLAVATGSGTLLATVAVGQAALAGAVLASDRLRPVERATLAATTALVGATAFLGALGLVAAALVDDEVPLAGAGLLAALAGAWVAAARLRDDEVVSALGGAGTALALLPAPLLALGAGRPDVVAAVLAAEGLAALALAGVGRLLPVERGILRGLAPVALLLGTGGAAVVAAHAIAVDAVDDRILPIATLAVVALGLLGLGRGTDRDDLSAVGAALVFVPAPLAVAGLGSTAVLTWVLLAQAAVAAVLAARTRGLVRDVLQGGAVVSWAGAFAAATTMGVAGWAATPTEGPAGSIAALLAVAALAVVAALRSGWGCDAVATGLGAAALPIVVAGGLTAGGTGSDGRVGAVLAACALVGAVSAVLRRVDPERPWLAPQVTGLAVGAVAGTLPLLGAGAVASLVADRATAAPGVGADVVVADWLRPALERISVSELPGWATVGQLAVLAVLAGVLSAWQRRAGVAAGLLVAGAGLVVVPVVAGLTVSTTVVGLGVVLVAGAEAVRRRPSSPGLLGFVGLVGLLGFGLARASDPAVVTWTVLASGLLVGLTALRARALDAATPVWTAVAGAVVLGTVGLDTDVLGATTEQVALAFAVTAVALAATARPLELLGLRPARSGDASDPASSVATSGSLVDEPGEGSTSDAPGAWAAPGGSGSDAAGGWLTAEPDDGSVHGRSDSEAGAGALAGAFGDGPVCDGPGAWAAPGGSGSDAASVGRPFHGASDGARAARSARPDRGAFAGEAWSAAGAGSQSDGPGVGPVHGHLWSEGAAVGPPSDGSWTASAAGRAMQEGDLTSDPWSPFDAASTTDAASSGPGGQAAAVLDVVVALAAAWAVAIRPAAPILSAVLALAAVAAGVMALRPTRRPVAFLAGALAVLSLWAQLGHAGVALVEAYSLPLAAGALAVGLVAGRGRGSWERLGAALVIGLGPSTVLAFIDPDPLRAVAVVLAGGALVVLGAVRRLQAPLAVGGVVVAAIAVRHLLPVATEVPRSAALACVGLVLLAVGATFEQRRQDLRQARDSFSRLA